MISIIIPTYNNSQQLVGTVQSISKQSYNDIEIVIIDDASTDDTKNQIEKLNNQKIKYYYNIDNLGTTQSRLKGLKHASGEYIAFLDDDDLWSEKKIELQKLALDNNKSLDFIMCNYKVNDAINKIQYEVSLNKYALNYQKLIHSKPGPFLQCCLFRSEFIKKHYNLFDDNSMPSEDWDWFMSIATTNPKIENINQTLFTWNLSSKSQSANVKKEAKAIEYIIEKHQKNIILNTNRKNLSLQYRRIAGMYKVLKNYALTKKFYDKAYQCNPISIKNIMYKIQYIK